MKPIERAVEIIGSQSAVARIFGIKPQAVQLWCSTGKVPAERVLEIERATNGDVSRHELRPDIYPNESAA